MRCWTPAPYGTILSLETGGRDLRAASRYPRDDAERPISRHGAGVSPHLQEPGAGGAFDHNPAVFIWDDQLKYGMQRTPQLEIAHMPVSSEQSGKTDLIPACASFAICTSTSRTRSRSSISLRRRRRPHRRRQTTPKPFGRLRLHRAPRNSGPAARSSLNDCLDPSGIGLHMRPATAGRFGQGEIRCRFLWQSSVYAFGFYVALNALILLVLGILVTRARVVTKTDIGDGGKPEMAAPLRAHGNNSEWTSASALLLMWALASLPTGSIWLIHGVGVPLTSGRILHGIGLSGSRRARGNAPLRRHDPHLDRLYRRDRRPCSGAYSSCRRPAS